MCFFQTEEFCCFYHNGNDDGGGGNNDHETLLGFLYLSNYSFTREKQMKKTKENDKNVEEK